MVTSVAALRGLAPAPEAQVELVEQESHRTQQDAGVREDW